ncbi:MAG: DUF3592 domain-containing protein [Propionivibrio sp.]|uniref:DUF3592 domain-containing protein n=1 Tax=Candidatus Propionivibrio dominans TaxID=2954373 RepID=A0A9D7FAJ3_9RHOO|nr:DUF3592 domain-containing protein [Candidatus Propionivibrio dominans]
MNLAFREMHPALWVIVVIQIAVDIFLVLRLVDRWQQYTQAQRWPRLTVKADSVQLVRVAYEREGSPTSRQDYYEAIFDYRYQVAGLDYHKQSVRQVASQSDADAMKEEAKISFLYNPADPAQTLDAAPGPAAVIGTVIGLLILNSMMFGLFANVQNFFGMNEH